MFRPFLTSLLALAFWLSLSEFSEAQNKQKIEFTFLYWQGQPKEQLYYRDNKDFLPLEFKLAQRSAVKELSGETAFQIYRKIENPEEDELPYQLVGKSNIPPARKVLFVVIPKDNTNPQEYDVFGMDDSLLTFPSGAFQFVNFTTDTLTVLCGSDSVKLPAKGVNQIKSDKERGGFSYFAIYDSKNKQIAGTRLFGQPKGREMVFIIPPTNPTASVRLKFFSEIVHAKPSEEDGGEKN